MIRDFPLTDMCSFDIPDCFNCPYPDCTASSHDIQRQWKNKEVKALDNIDQIPEKRETIAITYTEQVRERQKKYNRTEKGKARFRKYAQSEKGKAAARRTKAKQIASGKNAEWCRRYREKKKVCG